MLDALRQPLESGETVIARANHRIAYPSRFQLIAAMNPCKCGGGNPGQSCKRGSRCAAEYQARLSGPFLDRIDLEIEMGQVSAADLVLPAPAEGSAEVRVRVAAARERQRVRYTALGAAAQRVRTNADCSGRLLDEVAAPDEAGLALLRQASDALRLSARGFHRTLRVARTIADLDGVDRVGRVHVAEALSYRGEAMRQQHAAWDLSPRDLRQDVHLAALGDRLQQRVLIDLAVDGDGEPLLQMRRELGKAIRQARKELAHGGRLDVDLGDAAGELAQVADQDDVGHVALLG